VTQPTWIDTLHPNPIPWLLEPENPCVRYLTLTQLLDHSDQDQDVSAAQQAMLAYDPVQRILDAQWPQGYWLHPGVGYSPKYKATVWQIIFLAAMGLPRCEPLERAVAYVLAHSRLPDGRFSAGQDEQGAVLCLNGNLLRALIGLGYADDPAVLETRQAMTAQIAGEGLRCRYNSPAGNRPVRMVDGLPCAWGGIKALGALVALPPDRRTAAEAQAVQQIRHFLLAHNLASGDYPTATATSPLWWKPGFPLGYSADVLEALTVLLLAGASAAHPAIQAALSLLAAKRDAHGRWPLAHTPGNGWASFGPLHEPNKWVTWRALLVFKLST